MAEERTHKLVFTESEIAEKIETLRQSKNIELYLAILKGQREFEELQTYEGLINGEQKQEPKQEVQQQAPAPVQQQQAPAPVQVQAQVPQNPYSSQ